MQALAPAAARTGPRRGRPPGAEVEAEVELRRRAQRQRTPRRSATRTKSAGASASARAPSSRPSAAQRLSHGFPGRSSGQLERARHRLAPVRERVTHEPGEARRRRGAAPGEPQERGVHPRPGAKHGAIHRPQQLDVAGKLDEHAGRPIGPRARVRPQAVGDLPLHHHRPRADLRQLGHRPQQDRGGDRVGQVRDHRGGRRPKRPEIDPHRVAPHNREIRMPGGHRPQVAGQPPVQLDHVQVRDPGRDPVAQRPLPSPDLERDVARIELRIASDRLQQVGVGEKVLAQPHHPNTRAAFASTSCSSSWYGRPRSTARPSATSTTLAG